MGWKVYESRRGMPLRDLDGNELTGNLTDGMEVLVPCPFTGGFEKCVVHADSDGPYAESCCNVWFLAYSDDENDKGWGVTGGANKMAIRMGG